MGIRKGKFIGENPREGMFYDAEEAGVKIGAARVTIQGLLGEPDGTWAREDSWHLGRAGYAPDYETLTIVYDKNDIVTDVGISQP